MRVLRRSIVAALRRFWRSRHTSLWPVGLLFVALAALAILRNDPTTWIGDNRFELYENPGRRIARMLSLWDPTRGTGRIRADFWPGVTLPIGALRALGFSSAVTQHIWHGSLIAGGGLGAAAFLRRFVPRIGVAHVVCGLVYMFGPYTVGFLLPSNLYLNYAIAPWIFLLFHRGIHDRDRWRPAAALALLVFLAGNTEVAGLIYAFMYLVPIALFCIVVERSTSWGRLWSWTWRFGLLAGAVSATAGFTSVVGGEIFDQNLRETEAPNVLNGNSSWAESWRGLGSWLLYHRDVTGFSRPQVLAYLSEVGSALASFAPPVAAAIGVVALRGRIRVLFAALMAMGLVLMVGLYPLSDPSPYGQALDWGYDNVPNLSVLRNNYKAGSGMMMGTAALAGMAVAAGFRWIARSEQRAWRTRVMRVGAVGALAVVSVLGSAPFWRGELYNPAWELDEVPPYVGEAMAWLDEQPSASRVLVLPRAYRNGFRWGWVNDDVLDAYLARPHVVDVPIHLSRPVPADLISAVDQAVVDRRYRQGRVGQLAAALGVDTIVIRNDHDWETWDQPRPSDYDDLRNDPDVTLVASFGEPGEYTTDPEDTAAQTLAESELPPIEIYRVDEARSTVWVSGPQAETLVSGDGGAVPLLASGDLLEIIDATRFTGDLNAAELAASLDRGSPLIITDTNRRRVEVITTAAEESYTLAAGQRLARIPYELFEADSAETVATYGDVAFVRASGSVAFTGGQQPWHRPSNALDGDPLTTWLVGGLVDPVGERFRVEFIEPTDIDGVRILAAEPAGGLGGQGRRLTGATLAFSDGTVASARIVDGRYQLDVDVEGATWFELIITDVDGIGLAPVGLAEVELAGADTVERIAAPRDVFDAALDSPGLAEALSGARVGYAFGRVVGEGPLDEERALRRSFEILRDDELTVTGRLRLSLQTSADVLSAVAETEIRARADGRFLGNPSFAGARAVDGDDSTAWIANPTDGVSITLDFPRREVDEVVIRARAGQGLSAIRELTVTVGDVEQVVSLPAPSCPAGTQCPVLARIPVPAVADSTIVVSATAFDVTGIQGPNPFRVDEIEINGEPNATPGVDGNSSRCIGDLVEFNGSSFPVRLTSSIDATLRGLEVDFVGCGRLEVEVGRGTVDNGAGVIVDQVFLLPEGLDRRDTPTTNTVEVLAQSPTELLVDVDMPDAGLLVLGQSHHPAWEARIGEQDLGPAIEIGSYAAWRMPEGSQGEVRVSFRWQEWFEASLAVTGLGVVVSTWLVLRRRV